MDSNNITVALRLIGYAVRLWWGDWFHSVVISLAVILASSTIVLAGPALLGVCAVGADLADGVGSGFLGWWKGFTRYFWQGITWGMVNLAFIVTIIVSQLLISISAADWASFSGFLFVIFGFLWGLAQFYTPGYLIEQEEHALSLAWKNSFLMMITAPGMTFVFGIFTLIVILGSIGLVFPLIMGSVPLLGLLSVLAARSRFEESP